MSEIFGFLLKYRALFLPAVRSALRCAFMTANCKEFIQLSIEALTPHNNVDERLQILRNLLGILSLVCTNSKVLPKIWYYVLLICWSNVC